MIAALRRALGDSATRPSYLETIRQRGYRLIAPVRALSDATGERSLARGWLGQSPFCGLEPFGPSHASVFFGRDGAVEPLCERMARQWERGQPLVLLLGQSGCGKTSLVRAGLIPALSSPCPDGASLRICSSAVADLGMTDEFGPWATLAGALLDWEIAAPSAGAGFQILSKRSERSALESIDGPMNLADYSLLEGLARAHRGDLERPLEIRLR